MICSIAIFIQQSATVSLATENQEPNALNKVWNQPESDTMKQRLRSLTMIAVHLSLFSSSLFSQSFTISKSEVLSQMKRVRDWQLANLPEYALRSDRDREKIDGTSWHRAALLTGLMAAHRTIGDEHYLHSALAIANENEWKLGPRLRHGYDHCIGQTYVEIYLIKREPSMVRHTREVFDQIVIDPMLGPKVGWAKDTNWSWCNALFMAPPAFARLAAVTGEKKYLDVMAMARRGMYMVDPFFAILSDMFFSSSGEM